MDFDDLVEQVAAPEKRAGKVADGIEHKIHEGAVMVAYAMHLLRTTEAHMSAFIQMASTARGLISPAGWLGAASIRQRPPVRRHTAASIGTRTDGRSPSIPVLEKAML